MADKIPTPRELVDAWRKLGDENAVCANELEASLDAVEGQRCDVSYSLDNKDLRTLGSTMSTDLTQRCNVAVVPCEPDKSPRLCASHCTFETHDSMNMTITQGKFPT